MVVTNEQVLGKRIRDLDIKQKYDVVISRLNRAGIELVPTSQTSLQFGDILNLVGRLDAIEAVTSVVGNVQQKLQQVQMLPVFIGIGLGVLLGSIPFYLPGFPAALKLGLAGDRWWWRSSFLVSAASASSTGSCRRAPTWRCGK